MSDTVFIDGLFELLDSYDGFIMDQWGVLHNGIAPYPHVLETLNELKARKKQVVILSNSAKRAAYNERRLAELGIKRTLYKSVVSAGEVTWQGLHEQKEGVFRGLGRKCLLVSRDRERTLLEGLDLEVVETPEEAEFILITGTDAPDKRLEDYEPLLRKSAARGLPAICANPDIVAVFGSDRIMGPGRLAQRYQEFGGVAHFIGKPHAPIFRHCLGLFDNVLPARVLMIGDSLYHDIGGAHAIDLDGAFITTGIHASAFPKIASPEDKRKNMEQLVQNYGARPKWVMEGLRWMTAEARARYREREKIKV